MNFDSVKVRTEVGKVYVDCKTSDIKTIQTAVWLYGGRVSVYFLWHEDGKDIYTMSYLLETENMNFIIYGLELDTMQYLNQFEAWEEKRHKHFKPQTCLTLINNSYFLPYEQD